MNKKILWVVLIMGFLLLFSMTSLAKADNKVAASETSGPVSKVVPGETSITPSGCVHMTGLEYDFKNNHLTIGATTYIFYSYNIFDMNYNPTSQSLIIHSDAIWYVGSGTEATDSGFAGNIETTQYGMASFPPPTSYSSVRTHCTLQGFGSFEGQTLVLSYETGDPGWAGFVIMH